MFCARHPSSKPPKPVLLKSENSQNNPPEFFQTLSSNSTTTSAAKLENTIEPSFFWTPFFSFLYTFPLKKKRQSSLPSDLPSPHRAGRTFFRLSRAASKAKIIGFRMPSTWERRPLSVVWWKRISKRGCQAKN